MPPSRRRGDVQVVGPGRCELALLLVLLVAAAADRPRASAGPMGSALDAWVTRQSVLVCNGIPKLSREQRELCHRNPDVTEAAVKGLQVAVAECQHQFQWHRWNCSSLTPSSLTQHSSVMLKRGYRETGFVYAVSAAGVAHSVSRACSMGRLLSCGCDPSSYTGRATKMAGGGTQWKWGGCSHNLEFGMEFSRQFLDAREVAGDIQSTVNLHNNQVGRNALASSMQIRCKCHGMSGSCELKTCWKVVPEFRLVGRALKSRFRNAVAVTQSNFGNVQPQSPRAARGQRRRDRYQQQQLALPPRQQRKHRNSGPASLIAASSAVISGSGSGMRRRSGGGGSSGGKSQQGLDGQLFFFQKSPTFCERDADSDIAGTTGRRCNKPSAGGDGCASLCCGRGYNVIRQRRSERCGCKFHWCCFVECQNCTVEEWITVCK